jgi:peptide/nickel transport system permease protein
MTSVTGDVVSAVRERTTWRGWWAEHRRVRRFLTQGGVLLSLAWVLLMIAFSLFAPLIAPHDPNAQNLSNTSAAIGAHHWLGTDDLGRDVLSRLIYGAQSSMQVTFETVGLAMVAALVIGLTAGFRGGWLDYLLMRGADAGLAFPPLVLALAVVAVVGTSINDTSIALAIVFSPGFARFVRGQTLAIREESFVEASTSIGTPPTRIVLVRILPNVMTGLVVGIALALGSAVLAESGLAFLGLGPAPPAASWGDMLQEAYNTQLFTHPWALVPAGLTIALTVLAFNTIGDALRDILSGATTSAKRQRGMKRQRGITTVVRPQPAAPALATVQAAMLQPAQLVEMAPVAQPFAVALPNGIPLDGADVGSNVVLSDRGSNGAPHNGAGAPALLEVRGLSVDFDTPTGRVRVVDDVSFDVAEGKIVGLVGESGSGKTVSSMAVLRLLPSPPAHVSGGTVRFNGKDLLAMEFDELRRVRGRDIAMVFQDPLASLDPSFTIGYQLMEAIRLHEKVTRAAARDRAGQLLESVHIPDPKQRLSSYPHQLSGGMRQRVMIAMALSCHPKLLIADEPTTALDVTVQAQIVELLVELREKENLAVLFVTHDLALISELSDEIVVMYAGQVVEQSPTAELFRRPRHPYTSALLGASPGVRDPSQRLTLIAGQVPTADSFPSGCRFHPRCDYAQDACRTDAIAMVTADGDRQSRCRRVDELVLPGVGSDVAVRLGGDPVGAP